MKKLLAIFILACIFLSPALTSSAAAHDYDYVYTDVNIITPDSFEDIFSETEADRASFTYEMATLNSSRAVVAMEIELKVGSDYYTTIVSGDIPVYTLPSGDTLYEGPISGTMTVSEDEYRVTAGFTKLESTGGVLVSVTMQGDSTMVAFSFGENLIQGEVLDFFMEKAGSGQQNNTAGSNVIGNLDSDEFGSNPGDTASPMLIPGFSPITHPGEGGGGTATAPYPNLGPDGEWKFQRVFFEPHNDESFNAIETRVYYDITSNNMIVMVHPCISETQTYVEETYGPTAITMLYAINIEVMMLQSTGTSYAEFDGYSIPNTDCYTTDILGVESIYLAAFVKEFWRTHLSISGNIFDMLETSVHGKITVESNQMLHKELHIDLSFLSAATSSVLEEVLPGLPFLFGVEKGNPDLYAGGTEYRVITELRYCAILGPFEGENVTSGLPIYISKTLSFDAEIDLP